MIYSRLSHRLARWALRLLLTGGCLSALCAQEAKQFKQVDFRVYLWPKVSDLSAYASKETGGNGEYVYSAPQIAYQATPEGKVVSLDLNDGRLSKVYHYRGAGPLVFFREEAMPDGQMQRIPLATADAAALGGGNFVLVLVPSRDPAKPGYKTMPIRIPPSGVPKNEALFFNLTQYRLAVHTGKTPKFFEPGAVHPMPTNTDATMPLKILIEDDGDWGLRYTDERIVGKNEQLLFFIYPHDKAKNRVLVRSLNIALPPPPPAAAVAQGQKR